MWVIPHEFNKFPGLKSGRSPVRFVFLFVDDTEIGSHAKFQRSRLYAEFLMAFQRRVVSPIFERLVRPLLPCAVSGTF